MADNPSMGLFSKLPYGVREQIWQHFLPQGHDTPTARAQKSDLRILRASRELHDEITARLYSNLSLYFELSPLYQRNVWITVYYHTGRRGNKQDNNGHDDDDDDGDRGCGTREATWILRNQQDAETRGFRYLPYNLIKAIRVYLLSPNPKDRGQLVWLWLKMTKLVKLLKAASSIRNIIIWFQEDEAGGWYNSDREGLN